MWIITKLSGVISSDAVTRFTENTYGTHAHVGPAAYLISDKPVLKTIVEALKNNDDFVEVE
jgi:hypothetical protein